MAKNFFITFRVTEREKKELKKEAKTYGYRTLSAYIRKVLRFGEVV